jgi:hypothetical protein
MARRLQRETRDSHSIFAARRMDRHRFYALMSSLHKSRANEDIPIDARIGEADEGRTDIQGGVKAVAIKPLSRWRRTLPQEVATDSLRPWARIRKADRSRASGPPVPGAEELQSVTAASADVRPGT